MRDIYPRKMFVLSIMLLAAFSMMAGLLLTRQAVGQGKPLDGFYVKEVRFDETTGGKKPVPKLPKDWRFVGVSNGGKTNCNILWFQDKEGSIYMVRGSTDIEFRVGDFVLDPYIGKIGIE